VGKMALLKIITNRIEDIYEYDYHIPRASEMVLPIPIGYTHNGLLVEDLSRVYNILVGGYVGGGKSNFIHTTVNTLLNIEKPPKITIIDFKIVEYPYLDNHILLITEQNKAEQFLSRLVDEMNDRLQTLKQANVVNIAEFNKQGGKMEYIVLIIDELADLESKNAQKSLENLLRKSRAPGIHIILATQRPDATIFESKKFSSCKSNLIGRLCYQVADGINSKIILDSTEAKDLPNIPGRGLWKFGKIIEVQTPYLDPKIARERLYEQSAKRSKQGFFNGRDNKKLGNHDYGSNTNTVIPISKSSTAQIGETMFSKATKSLQANKPLQLLCGKAKRYFTED
jgi:S-DNA-T family DNA segregation ATPase FtsK/SpoIIIE